jgi:hypothetical protein
MPPGGSSAKGVAADPSRLTIVSVAFAPDAWNTATRCPSWLMSPPLSAAVILRAEPPSAGVSQIAPSSPGVGEET